MIMQKPQHTLLIPIRLGADDSNLVATTLPAQRQQLSALLDFEQNARRIVEVSPLLVPGLLQTNDYIKAIMAGIPPTELATRVTVHIGRREVITGKSPAQLLALVGEAALLQLIGSADTALEQLRYLLEMMQRPNIEVRVIRFNGGWNPALEGPFLLIEYDASTVVHLENRKSGLFLHEDADVNAYQRAADKVMEAAMSADASRKLIVELIKMMESKK